MPSRRLFANWTVRAAGYLLILLGSLFPLAHAQAPAEFQIGVGYVLTTVLSLLGILLGAVIAIWSKNQDRRIENAQRTADEALRLARTGREDLLGRYRPAEDHERAFERAIKPLVADVAEVKKDLKHVERMLHRVSSASGRHDALILPEEG